MQDCTFRSLSGWRFQPLQKLSSPENLPNISQRSSPALAMLGSILPPRTAFCIPKLAQQSCWSLAPSYPTRIGKDGERGRAATAAGSIWPSWPWIWLFSGNPLPEFPFSEAQSASALAHSCHCGFQAKLHQTPQLLMGTHSLELIVCCFPVLLFSKTHYKTSMLCRSCKIPSRTSVTCNRARALEGGSVTITAPNTEELHSTLSSILGDSPWDSTQFHPKSFRQA